jgi:hypothetical protein
MNRLLSVEELCPKFADVFSFKEFNAMQSIIAPQVFNSDVRSISAVDFAH